MESRAAAHEDMAEKVLTALLPHAGKARRIGITGVPGVGKSTFIEALGMMLCDHYQHRVAVMTVDPTSALHGGSILGDKTRMEQLSRHPNAFIRPSAAGDTLGGVARKTREAMLICEAAGFDVILVETVGVGQSEIAVRSMVDFFLLMILPGGGDELQGIKKGIVELADALFVNKADGPNRELAEAAQREYAGALRYLTPLSRGWRTEVFAGSAITGQGLPEIWSMISKFYEDLTPSGFIARRRSDQTLSWWRELVREEIGRRFFRLPAVQALMPTLEQALERGDLTLAAALRQLFDAVPDLAVSSKGASS